MHEAKVGSALSTLPTLRRAVVAFGFLLVAEFFYSWSWYTVDVLRPFIKDSLGLTLTQAGAGYSAQGAGALFGALLIGQLADRFGRRRVLSSVMIGYGVSAIAGVWVASFAQLIAQRFVLGLFLGGVFPVVVGTYVGLFADHVRGRLASMVTAVASSAVSVLGLVSGAFAHRDWHLMLWMGGLPPILLSVLAPLLIPRSVDARGLSATPVARVPLAELFVPGLRARTLMLAALCGLNFFAFQAYSGWLTTYLRDVRGVDAAIGGQLVAWQFGANVVGCFFWGWAGDRYGRRFPALGLILAGLAIAIYLSVPTNIYLLASVGMLYGFMLSSSVIWGPWLTELYPPHLKSTAASIFNWGRLVSFFAPLITGELARRFGLGATMIVASVTFVAAGALWLALPETHPEPRFRLFGRGRDKGASRIATPAG